MGVGGGLVGVGLGLLHFAGGINVASKWGCVQGVWVQCRCWSVGMGVRVSNVCWGITKVATQNCDHSLVVRNGVAEVCVCVCARVRGTVWCVVSGLRGVLIGPLIAWNRTNHAIPYTQSGVVVTRKAGLSCTTGPPAEPRQSNTSDYPINQVVGTAHPNAKVRNLQVVLE